MAFVLENLNLIEQRAIWVGPSPRIDRGNDSSEHIHTSTDDDYAESDYPSVLKEQLTALTLTERIGFGTAVWILFVISLCGNVCTLHVNFRRKIRPFHRASLISLAVSDLMNTIFLAVPYLTKFTTQFVELWILGSTMCHLVPFLTTAAILVSSMTLVGIALDRYYAVMRAVTSFWNPGVICSVLSTLIVWATSIAISYPTLRVYKLHPVYILTVATDTNLDDDADSLENSTTDSATTETIRVFTASAIVETDTQSGWQKEAVNKNLSSTPVTKDELVIICAGTKSAIVTYYFIVFFIIFLPSIIAFVWINAVIAQQLWKRRHNAAARAEKQSNDTKNFQNRWQMQSGGLYLKKSDENLRTISSNVAAVEYTYTNERNPSDPYPIRAKEFALTSAPTQSTTVKTCSNREARHIRMFIVIIVLISTFLCLRLPAWIFFLFRLHGFDSPRLESCLNFSFGVLNLTSSMLNPFFYTYQTETIKIADAIKRTVCKVICECGLRQKKHNHSSTRPTEIYGECDCGGVPLDHSRPNWFGSRWLNKASFCSQKLFCKSFYSKSNGNKEPKNKLSDNERNADANEKDEGIDCGDESIGSDKQSVAPGILLF